MKQKTLIVGTGYMGKEYAKALDDLGVSFDALCRTKASAESFSELFKCDCYSGGIEDSNVQFSEYSNAIVAVSVENLKKTCEFLIEKGILSILVEKPAGINRNEIEDLLDFSIKNNSRIGVAYNRRYFAAAIKAKEIIKADGGALSGNFEFTEWSHKIEPLKKGPGVKENWFLANSTHVVDLAFYLMGKPIEMSCQTSGELSWHKPAIFAGSGITENDVLFNYSANWVSAGRWGVEVLTSKRKLILSPMEELQEQLVGTIAVQKVEGIDYSKDEAFKPGIWVQTKYFIEEKFELLKSLEEQVADMDHYDMMLGVADE